MPTINKNVDFLDNDDQGKPTYTDEQKAAHQHADVMHKLFYIQQAMKDSHAMNQANKKQKASKSGRSRGGVLNGQNG
ncbi:TPA: hypothetical protein SCS57_002047 [Enterobacter cloacae]|nr:hypothetical protein [Enterobacter cloacae]